MTRLYSIWPCPVTLPSRLPDQLSATIQAIAKAADRAMNGGNEGDADTAVGSDGTSIRCTPRAATARATASVTMIRRPYRWPQVRRTCRAGTVAVVQSPGAIPRVDSATDSVGMSGICDVPDAATCAGA